MDRYIGLDVHSTSSTITVVGPSGRKLQSQVLETNGQALIAFLKTLPRPRHLCLEEGCQSTWLYEVLSPHADEFVRQGQSKPENGVWGSSLNEAVGVRLHRSAPWVNLRG